ncbi:hypothetical protein AUP68_13433 [Ilyonectria robusta]
MEISTPLHFLNDILHETGRVLLEAGADPTILVRGNPSAVNKFAELQDFSASISRAKIVLHGPNPRLPLSLNLFFDKSLLCAITSRSPVR